MRLRTRRRLVALDSQKNDPRHHDVEEAIDRLAVGEWVWSAIGRLPAEQAVAVMLRYFTAHQKYEEIAAVLGVPIGTVRSRLHQAKRKLSEDLLGAAARADPDHHALVDERTQWWLAAAEELHHHGTADLYADGCTPDVLVEEPGTGYRVTGIGDHRRGVESSAAAGVRMRVSNVAATATITIVEGTYLNPRDDPRHCPATHTEVRVLHRGRTTRLTLYHRLHE